MDHSQNGSEPDATTAADLPVAGSPARLEAARRADGETVAESAGESVAKSAGDTGPVTDGESVAETVGESVAVTDGESVTVADDVERALDDWADEVRQQELANALSTLSSHDDLDPEQRTAVAACSRALVDKLLRCPRWRLRTDSEAYADPVRTLFDLRE